MMKLPQSWRLLSGRAAAPPPTVAMQQRHWLRSQAMMSASDLTAMRADGQWHSLSLEGEICNLAWKTPRCGLLLRPNLPGALKR
jgi:hypothetical protein